MAMTMFLMGTEKEGGKDVGDDDNILGKTCDGDNGDGDNSDGIDNNIGGNDSNDSNDVVNPPDSFCSQIADGSDDCENIINSSAEDDKNSSSDQISNDSDSDNDDVEATPSRGKNAKSLLNLRQRSLPTAKNRGGKPPKLKLQYKSSSESDSDNNDVGAQPPRGKNGKSLLNQ